MTTEQIVQLLINGECVVITDDSQAKEVQKRLREIKKNCTEVLTQLKERL
jgi:uncharacterized protein YlzI (FlbEa/FlbD family)